MAPIVEPTGLIQQIKPRNARSARALKARESQTVENPKITLFARYTSSSEVLHLLSADLRKLKNPLVIQFDKKNKVRPFEDPSSLEFFSSKNDASLFVYGSHSKKRPHMLTLARMFEHRLLDLLELHVDPETMRTLSQFKNKRKAAVGLKPLVCFSGSAFEGPGANEWTMAKSLLLDLFRREDTDRVDVEGLQSILYFAADEETKTIHMRNYLVKTRRSGSRLPRVELEETGPRADLRIGRCRHADPDMLKDAMKKPRGQAPRAKKNVTTDLIGDKLGRIHVGKQEIAKIQTRKMKGLKRGRGEGDEGDANGADAPKDDKPESKRAKA